MVLLKTEISPFLFNRIESLIEDGFFSSSSNLVNIAHTEFFVNPDFGFDWEDDISTMNSGILMMLLMTLMKKEFIKKDDFKDIMDKIEEGEFLGEIEDAFGDIYGSLFDNIFEPVYDGVMKGLMNNIKLDGIICYKGEN